MARAPEGRRKPRSCVRARRRESEIVRVETRNRLARLYEGADVHQPLDDLAADAECQRHFVARTHLAASRGQIARDARGEAFGLDQQRQYLGGIQVVVDDKHMRKLGSCVHWAAC